MSLSELRELVMDREGLACFDSCPRAPQLEETPETPPSSRAEGLLFLFNPTDKKTETQKREVTSPEPASGQGSALTSISSRQCCLLQ